MSLAVRVVTGARDLPISIPVLWLNIYIGLEKVEYLGGVQRDGVGDTVVCTGTRQFKGPGEGFDG